MRFSLTLAVAASLIAPAAAHAAPRVSSDGETTLYRSGNEAADLRADHFFDRFQVQERRGGLLVGAGCSSALPTICPGFFLTADLAGGDDRMVSLGRAYQTVTAGVGNDAVWTSGERSTVSAGAGNDYVRTNANQGSEIHGDGGDDVLWGYEIAPTLHGDGGQDFLFAEGLINTVNGGAGNDQIVGRGERMKGGTIDAGPGNDVIAFLPGPADADETWTIAGGDGADDIRGSGMIDTIAAGPGSDLVDVRGDAWGDTVTCGGGFDVVYADASDTVASDCELRVDYRAPWSWTAARALERAAAIRTEMDARLGTA